MRRTLAVILLAVSSLAAAAIAAIFRPAAPAPPVVRKGALQISTQLDRRYLPESGVAEAYLQVDLTAGGDGAQARRVPVNAVLVLDRSGSMRGPKIERARDAARALVAALGEQDRLAIIEFSGDASVLLPSTAMTAEARARALAAIAALEPMGGTNMSAAFDIAGPELGRGRSAERMDKVFLASDGQANEGVSDRGGLLTVAQRDFGAATVSTFGMGEDYDEDLMSALAAQAGGRARYIQSPEVLPDAFHAELSRAASAVARDVRIRVTPLAGARVESIIGYDTHDGWARLPDFAAGEERRVLVKLALPPSGRGLTDLASVELQFGDARGESQKAFAVAQATFTSDRGQLAQGVTHAAVEGARMEMAQMANQAAQAQEEGRYAEAQQQMQAMKAVAQRTAALAPKDAPEMDALAADFGNDISTINGRGSVGSKKVKEKAFNAVRAPVKGW